MIADGAGHFCIKCNQMYYEEHPEWRCNQFQAMLRVKFEPNLHMPYPEGTWLSFAQWVLLDRIWEVVELTHANETGARQQGEVIGSRLRESLGEKVH